MAGFGVVFDSNMDEWAGEFARLRDVTRPIADMEILLHNMFADMQAVTHVVTGSLRGSGKVEDDILDGVWIGRVGEGGSSPGFPNDPVDYAETERARGSDHDFLRNMPVLADGILAIIEAHLAGRI